MPDRPVLIYDGDCAFCQSSVDLLERLEPRADIVAWQLTDLTELGITEEQAAGAVQWIDENGAVRGGHEAIAGILGTAGQPWKSCGRMLVLPGISWVAAKVYQLVANNRYRLPGGTPACAAPQSEDR